MSDVKLRHSPIELPWMLATSPRDSIAATIGRRSTNSLSQRAPASPGVMRERKERVTLKPGQSTLLKNFFTAHMALSTLRHATCSQSSCTDHSSTHSIMSVLQMRSPRKFRAMRALPCHDCNSDVKDLITDTPPWTSGSRKREGASRTELYALINDRYPGAPGTALALAEEDQKRSIQAEKRKEARKNAANAEWEHLGLKNLSKRRKSSSPYAGGTSSNSETSSAGSDTDNSTPSATQRSASRQRRAPSRNGSPMPLTNVDETVPRLPPHIANAPAFPSPLATQSVSAGDLQ